jgi:hypothetical protein
VNLLFHLACTVQGIHHLLRSLEYLLLVLIVIHLLRLLHHELLLARAHHLLLLLHLQHLPRVFKGIPIPIFKTDQKFLLQHINLLLGIVVILFVDFQVTEHISILLFQVLHFPQKNQLLLIDDVFWFIAKFILALDLLLL